MTDSSSDMVMRRSISETKYHVCGRSLSRGLVGTWRLARELGEEEHLAWLLGACGVLYADADADGPSGDVLDVHAELADAVPAFEAADVVDLVAGEDPDPVHLAFAERGEVVGEEGAGPGGPAPVVDGQRLRVRVRRVEADLLGVRGGEHGHQLALLLQDGAGVLHVRGEPVLVVAQVVHLRLEDEGERKRP